MGSVPQGEYTTAVSTHDDRRPFSGGRALRMQLAHPAVAQGVADHSGFEADPFARLRGTLDAMTTIVYGTKEQAAQVAAQVKAIHRRVRGDGYYANDPALLLWVHATL